MEYDIEVNATKAQIEELRNSIIWKDIVTELDKWANLALGEPLSIVANAASENPSTANVLMHMGDAHGRIKAIDYVKGILDMFESVIEARKDEKANNN